MNRRAIDTPGPGRSRIRQETLILAALAAMCLVAISRRSLWIDEAATAVQAMQPDLARWWELLVREKTAHLQMPFYMLYIWGYEKVFGSSEWALRIANAPWFIAGAVVFIAGFPTGQQRRLAAALVTLLCPFAWYYLDEARPYGMQLGAGLAVAEALAQLSRTSGNDARSEGRLLALFLVAVLIMSGSGLLGMVWAGGALALLFILRGPAEIAAVLKRHLSLVGPAALLLLLLGGYYVWTVSIGARATAVATTTAGSVLFIVYELLGFTGVGPGRLELRSAGASALHSYWPWLLLYGAVVGTVVLAALAGEMKANPRQLLAVTLACAAPAVFIVGVGYFAHFRALGRHFTPVVPVLLLVFASGVCSLWSRGSLWAKGLVVAFCTLNLASCLWLRFSPRHSKDDYRAAAAAAQAALAAGRVVWWNAAAEGARYYHVPITPEATNKSAALIVGNPTPETLRGLPLPQTVVASKPDVYDSEGALRGFLQEQHFAPVQTLQAFVIWSTNK